ncbi:MAG: asparagine--tRNA ligase [Oligoflexales bacterium]|nr:asparagine--tRNA ligase [Oligoflexales bacterium]
MKSLKDQFCLIRTIFEGKVALGPVSVSGWIRTRRDSRKFSFLEVNDGSSSGSIQIIADGTLPNYASDILKLGVGSSVQVNGELVLSKGSGQKYEIVAKSVEILGFADPTLYPLQKKEMTYEYLRQIAHLRIRTSTFASVFRIRARVSKIIHDFFEKEGFFYVQPPLITASECEGGIVPFQVTTLPLKNVPFNEKGEVDHSKDFFGSFCLLSGSAQLQGELLSFGLGRIYTFGPSFRAENSNTSRHLAEFWQIEPEMAFYNLYDTVILAQDLVRYIIKRYLDQCADDIETLVKLNGVDPRPNLMFTLDNQLSFVSYTDAVSILKKSGRSFTYPVDWGSDLQSEHERFLCEEHFKAPIAVYDYPEELKSFYMYVNDDGRTVHGADVLVPGVGEIVGSSQREHRLDVLKERMVKKGMPLSQYDWYLATRQFGTVPHSGFGMGLERLLMWITGMANIRDVIPFPRFPGSCLF